MQARSTRSASTYAAGVAPVSRRNARWNEALAHLRAGREARRPEVLVEVPGDPALQVAQRALGGGPCAQPGAELRLAARAVQEDDEVAGDAQRGLGTVVVLDERQGEVDARGHAGRGPDVAVADPDRLAVDLDPRMAARERVAPCPVRRGAAAVEQARLGEHERTRAHRRHAARPRRRRAHVVDRLGRRGARALATGDEQRVERPRAGRERLRCSASPLDVRTTPPPGASSVTA